MWKDNTEGDWKSYLLNLPQEKADNLLQFF